ncbi:MAG: carboxypeptidase regulatory-like domain-containing protein [Solirubrobacterales bacterium]|nr:carboxypeptidase regulatory-like domain-containing protein [Solirubrobacterales bacterium]
MGTTTRRPVRHVRRGGVLALGCLALTAGVAAAGTGGARTGTLAGGVTAPLDAAGATGPVAGATVTVTGPGGIDRTTSTAADGHFEFDGLPAPASYSISAALGSAPPRADAGVTVPAGGLAAADLGLASLAATVTGQVTSGHGSPLPGMTVAADPTSRTACPTGALCGPSTTTGSDGRYTLHVAPGTDAVSVLDGSRIVTARAVALLPGAMTRADVALPAAPVPTDTAARNSRRDLRLLNAERTRVGLPSGLVLNDRWSRECAAHDDYERLNHLLSHTENPRAPGASPGGAWAARVSLLAQARWTAAANPWEMAPIHLLQLFTPSLSVIGIDDGHGLQCATAPPGTVRRPVSADTIFTYPGNGTRGVPPRETAEESPFVPGQFVGIPAGRTAGRELFVYLDLAGRAGQAPVRVLRASLSRAGHPVTVRWVDDFTPTVGQYLTGAILIPPRPLAAGTTYRASVTVADRSGTLSHAWSFRTGAP